MTLFSLLIKGTGERLRQKGYDLQVLVVTILFETTANGSGLDDVMDKEAETSYKH